MLERVCASYEYVGPNYNNQKLFVIENLPTNLEETLKETLEQEKVNHYIIIAHGTTQTHNQ